jgi:hypothetical protein
MKISCLLALIFLLALPNAFGAAVQIQANHAELMKANPILKTLPNLAELHVTAEKGLDKYRHLVNQENFRRFGLQNAAQVKTAKLGAPLRDYLVRLDALKAYVPGSNPAALLTDTHIVHYPLVADGRNSASVSMNYDRGQWHLISVGDTQRTAKLHSAISRSVLSKKQVAENHFAVRIPALNLEFAACWDAKGTLFLTPIIDSPEWGLKEGVTEPASAVFGRLVSVAKSHDGLPH